MKSNYLGWLAFENCRGGNVYFSINPLVPGATRRTKDAVAEAKGLYLDLDSDGDAKLAAIRRSENVPQPSAVIQTSTGKYQVLWRVHGFTIPEQEAMLKVLAETFGGDRACTDCARVFRLPGFFNRKYTPAPLVTVEMGDIQTDLFARRFQTGNAGRWNTRIHRDSPCKAERIAHPIGSRLEMGYQPASGRQSCPMKSFEFLPHPATTSRTQSTTRSAQ